MSIVLGQVTKRYGERSVVSDLSLSIATGELFVLLGPSGSGKSTVLRMIAGLAEADAGRILLHGRDVTRTPPRARGAGFVFQHCALFRHMTVSQNVEFALRVRGVPARERARRRDELLELSGFGGRLPRQLSGGQQQRVALARALAHQPEVLLLDEPFGALDARIRGELRKTLRRIQRELGITAIFVTHDQDAFSRSGLRTSSTSGRRPSSSLPSSAPPTFSWEISASPGADRSFEKSVVLPNGRYKAVFALLTPDGRGLLSGTRTEFELLPVPKEFRVSALHMTNNVISVEAPPQPFEPFVFGGGKYVPKGDGQFSARGKVGYFVVIRNPDGEPEPSVSIRMTLYKDGQPFVRTPAEQAELIKVGERAYLNANAFEVGTFPPGRYRFIVLLRDLKASHDSPSWKEGMSVSTEFEVAPEAAASPR